jgi:hypothetical protein
VQDLLVFTRRQITSALRKRPPFCDIAGCGAGDQASIVEPARVQALSDLLRFAEAKGSCCQKRRAVESTHLKTNHAQTEPKLSEPTCDNQQQTMPLQRPCTPKRPCPLLQRRAGDCVSSPCCRPGSEPYSFGAFVLYRGEGNHINSRVINQGLLFFQLIVFLVACP